MWKQWWQSFATSRIVIFAKNWVSELSVQTKVSCHPSPGWKWKKIIHGVVRKCFAPNSVVKWNIFSTFVVRVSRDVFSKNRPKMSINKWWTVAAAVHAVKKFLVTTSIRTFLLIIIITEKHNSITACTVRAECPSKAICVICHLLQLKFASKSISLNVSFG